MQKCLKWSTCFNSNQSYLLWRRLTCFCYERTLDIQCLCKICILTKMTKLTITLCGRFVWSCNELELGKIILRRPAAFNRDFRRGSHFQIAFFLSGSLQFSKFLFPLTRYFRWFYLVIFQGFSNYLRSLT